MRGILAKFVALAVYDNFQLSRDFRFGRCFWIGGFNIQVRNIAVGRQCIAVALHDDGGTVRVCAALAGGHTIGLGTVGLGKGHLSKLSAAGVLQQQTVGGNITDKATINQRLFTAANNFHITVNGGKHIIAHTAIDRHITGAVADLKIAAYVAVHIDFGHVFNVQTFFTALFQHELGSAVAFDRGSVARLEHFIRSQRIGVFVVLQYAVLVIAAKNNIVFI